jgi:hypothetical protein
MGERDPPRYDHRQVVRPNSSYCRQVVPLTYTPTTHVDELLSLSIKHYPAPWSSETLVSALSLLAGYISGSLDDPSRSVQSIDLLTCKIYFGVLQIKESPGVIQ